MRFYNEYPCFSSPSPPKPALFRSSLFLYSATVCCTISSALKCQIFVRAVPDLLKTRLGLGPPPLIGPLGLVVQVADPPAAVHKPLGTWATHRVELFRIRPRELASSRSSPGTEAVARIWPKSVLRQSASSNLFHDTPTVNYLSWNKVVVGDDISARSPPRQAPAP